MIFPNKRLCVRPRYYNFTNIHGQTLKNSTVLLSFLVPLRYSVFNVRFKIWDLLKNDL